MNIPVQHKINKEKKYLIIAVAVTVVLFIGYVYLLSISVVEVVMRKEMNREIQDLQTEISRLETTYIDKQHAVSGEVASREGFIEAKDKIFIDRSDSSLVLLSKTRR